MLAVSVFCLFIATTSVHAQWELINSTLLRSADSGMAVGHYEGNIFLVGGTEISNDLEVFSTDSDSFSSYDRNFLDAWIYGYGQFYAQVDDELFIVDWKSNHLILFDLSNCSLDSEWSVLPTNIYGPTACLAASDDTLYYMGGSFYFTASDTGERIQITVDTLYLLDLETESWSRGPNMTVARRGHSCIVHGNSSTLFAIGGQYHYDWQEEETVSSIEYLAYEEGNSWTLASSNFTSAPEKTRAVEYEGVIYVIGGYGYDGASDKVYLIDAQTRTVSLSSQRLARAVYATAPIVVGNVIYAFGGRGDGSIYSASSDVDWWQRYEITEDGESGGNIDQDTDGSSHAYVPWVFIGGAFLLTTCF